MTAVVEPARVRSRRLPHGAAFWTTAVAFLAAMAFTTVPTPLYALYQARDGFPTWVVTVVFAAYAAGVAVSLYLVGHVSDWVGRRLPAVAAVVVEIAAAVLFVLSPTVPGLIVARILTGIGVGALTAAATAHLVELRRIARPDAGVGLPLAVGTVANIGGLGFGPLLGGVLAEYAPDPLVTPYVVSGAALVLAAVLLLAAPETVQAHRRPWRPQRIAVPAEGRGAFAVAAVATFSGFAVFGLIMSLSPAFLAVEFHETSRLAAGLLPFGVFVTGVVGALLLLPLRQRTQSIVATVAIGAGLVLLATGAVTAWLPLFVAGALVSGLGGVLLFRGAVATASALVPPSQRGEVLAAVFLVSYVGLTVPVLLAGAALVAVPPVTVLVVFSAVELVLGLVAGIRTAVAAGRVPRTAVRTAG